ncbi:hypothetical protein LZD49_20130 [Dyadobacter sp. CY261]|uniref:hypothetical protein n=1 Tax=Dyadobacter sp. CY261 TaxID=2907203 RepID=UPI001F220CA9|nr:hypothetical protein [Dyadobacter sp. CY261]MCF0072800.1 hypothetical protein [Dyadobacter sp. CY261]
METKTIYIAAVLLLTAGALSAQSTSGQTKPKQSGSEQKSTATDEAAKPSKGSKSSAITSEATTGTPPTHIDKTNSVPPASNPQNTGVNAANRKKADSTVQGRLDRNGNASKKQGQPSPKQQEREKAQP